MAKNILKKKSNLQHVETIKKKIRFFFILFSGFKFKTYKFSGLSDEAKMF
jgi:hypothetical protein